MTQKQMFELPIGPGQYTEQSERGAVGRWYSMDKVRFRKALAEKIGGWVQLENQFIGTCRRLRDWSSLDSKHWTAVATDTKLYVWQDGTFYDITPLRATGTLTDPFTTTISSAVVTVDHVQHGAQQGDYVRFSNATAVGGITIDGEYSIASIVDSDSYTITHASAATSGATGGGTVNYEYDISAGASSATTATGYGTGPYGREGYGNARTGSTLVLGIRTWSLDNWGEDLLACPRGGAIYWWDRSKGTGTRAAALGGDAPPTSEYMLISQRDRHVLALGAYDYFNEAFDPLLIRWCSTEDLNDWVPTSTNTSGDLRLYSGSKIVAGVRSRLETVVFTDVSVHTMPFVGGFDVFGLNIVGENVSILGPNCAVPVDHRVIFMAEADFYVYDGVVKVLPCDVRNFVYENLNVVQRDKIYGGLNREFNEVWWFYPSFEPDAWVQQDFSLGIPAGYSLAQPLGAGGAGTIGYTYDFNSAGFTTISATVDNNYEYDYYLTNDEPFITPLESEYAVEFAFDPNYVETGARWFGMTFLRNELSGTPNLTSDDAYGIMIEADHGSDTLRVRKRNIVGIKSAMDNDPGTTTFTTVSGSAAALDTKYIITAQVNGAQITVWLDGVQAFQFNLSAAEIALYTGGSAGFHAEANPDIEDKIRFYNFAAGPVGVLTAADFDISPIEVNRYVMFNYEEGSWATGKMARTAWADRSPLLEKPYAAGADGYLYQHETGTDDNGAAMESHLQSFDMEIPQAGEELMHVDQLIPDFLTLEGSVDVNLSGKKYPQAATRQEKGPYTVTASTRKISTRIRARQVAIKVSSSGTGDKWRMGNWRGRAGAHGKRG
jgi:hypothetical protein